MSTLSTKTIEHIAHLARLGFSEPDKERFARQLSDILDHAKEMQSVDTKNIVPMSHVGSSFTPSRSDDASESDSTDDIIANFPLRSGRYAKVEKVL